MASRERVGAFGRDFSTPECTLPPQATLLLADFEKSILHPLASSGSYMGHIRMDITLL